MVAGAMANYSFAFFNWSKQIIISMFIVSVLLFIVINFYIFASVVSITSFLYVFLLVSFITDGIFILLQLIRRKVNHKNIAFSPSKLTIVIACYNGEDVIGETLRQAKKHVPPPQIIVVSDASTDATVERATAEGVTVIKNEKNMSKVFSINRAMAEVKTPYVLIMDDDVLIGDTVIPTSLLEEGYTAVAFNVMPVKTSKFISKLQEFEYRGSMQIGKNLRGRAGAIGNVSGAIGLYRTEDLEDQISLHSGQFAGEDEQRTLFAHIQNKGKGITYTDQTVYTHVPQTVQSLFNQRAYSWSLAVPELFVLYWRILLSPHYHFLLKSEKAYSLYIYLTDPLRLLFLWVLVFRPANLIVIFLFYFAVNFFVWLRTGFKDSFFVVIAFPIYKLGLTVCRFIGNFYWFKVKAKYLRARLYRIPTRRKLMLEYLLVTVIFMSLWAVSSLHFIQDVQAYSQIRSSRLDEQTKTFEYESVTNNDASGQETLNLIYKTTPPNPGSYIAVGLEKGDTPRAIAHKAVQEIIESRPEVNDIPYHMRRDVDAKVLNGINQSGVYLTPTGQLLIDANTVNEAMGLSIGIYN